MKKDNTAGTPVTKLQRVIALILTIMFIPTIVFFGVWSIAEDPRGVLNSVKFYRAKNYLADENDTSFFPMTAARIASLETQLGKHIFKKDELGYLNASLQYLIGKDLVIAGSSNLLNIGGGQIYNMTTRESLATEAREMVAVGEDIRAIDPDLPFFFAYVNPQFYKGSTYKLPEAYEGIDTGDKLADEVIGILADAGIETLDSRDFFENCGYTDDDLWYKTDMHWTTLAGLLATRIYADKINEMMPEAHLDTSLIDIDQFDVQCWPSMFLGEYGQQVGEQNCVLDDITFYIPKYETSMSRYALTRAHEEQYAEGTFSDAVIEWDALFTEEGDTNVKGYMAYGLVEYIEEITNNDPNVPDITILLFRDSYSAPIGRFLALMCHRVVMIDMRTAEHTSAEFVKQYDPDFVIMSYSRNMLEHHSYDLGVTVEETEDA